MKVLVVLCIVLATVFTDECPAKLLKIAKKNVTTYLKGVYKKVGDIKLNCSYEHDGNIFNLEHHVKADTTYKNRKLSFELKTHSSMFDLYNFSDFNGNICHSKMSDLKESKDRKLIKQAFLQKYAKNINEKDIKRVEKNGQICYKAVIASSRKKKALL